MSSCSHSRLIQEGDIEKIAWLINKRSGILIKTSEMTGLRNKVAIRLKALNFDSDRYLKLLTDSGIDSHREWNTLIGIIAIGETYFFRDKDQLNIIKYSVIPELLKTESEIRILSAGCATGEEVYSLAILLKESGYDCSKAKIYGVDLNEASIAKAKRGVYTSWSFRGCSDKHREFFAKTDNTHWVIASSIKSMVSFHTLNLVVDELLHLGYFDVIVCRNVFIYFDRASIQLVLSKFTECLKPNGFLITGHTELCEQNMDKFEVINYNYGVIYQLRSNFSNFRSKDKERVVSSSQSQVNLVSQDNIDMVLAESYYHLGQLDEAQVALMKFLLKDATNYKANFLRFLIAKKQGDTKQAKERLGELIFLYPESPDPYIELIKCLLQDKEYKASSRLLSVVSKLKTLSPQNKLEIERLSSVCSSCRE